MVRKAKFEDAVSIAIIAKQLHVYHYNIRSDYFNIPDDKYFQDFIEQSINSNANCMFIVCELDSNVVGFASIHIAETPESEMKKHYKKCVVDSIAVEENHRSKGMGIQLLEYIKQFAEKHSCHTVELGVWYDNYNAVDFYAAFGFEPRMYKLEMKLN